MSGRDPSPRRRWTAEVPEEPAARLLARVARPTWSPTARARLRARLTADLTTPVRAPSRAWLLAATTGTLLLLGIAVGWWLRPGARAATVNATAGAVVVLDGDGGARLALVGPAVLRAGRPLLLEAGTLVARTGSAPVRVGASGADVQARPGSTIEVRVESSRVVVAVYAGGATARWSARGAEIAISAGKAAASRGAALFVIERATLIERWLAGPALTAEDVAPAPPSGGDAVVVRMPVAPATPVEGTVTTASVRRRQPSAGAVDQAIVRESGLLAQAMERVRRRHDGDGALQLLDRYQRDFPNGALRAEAQSIRLDALLLGNRSAAALAQLDTLPLDRTPRDPEFHVVRGELRAAAHRCAEAIADFTIALDRVEGVLAERARFGRAGCRLATGDRTGAEADFELYLSQFPYGRFAAAARQALAPPVR